MSISDMMKLRENPNIEIVIDSVNIVSGQGDNIDSKTDAGWKETLAKISAHHEALLVSSISLFLLPRALGRAAGNAARALAAPHEALPTRVTCDRAVASA